MPGTNFESDDDNFDAQDVAETLDEDKFDLTGLSDARRTFEELPDVLDMTQVEGDRDEDEAVALDADDFDPEALGDCDLEADDEAGDAVSAGQDGDDAGLDEALDETFPASDPVSLTRRED